MAAYKDLVGQKITKVTSNPGEPKTGQMWYNSTTGTLKGLGILEAWSSASPLITGRKAGGGSGSQTAALYSAGETTAIVTNVEEYNGSGWASGGAYPIAIERVGATGTQTATIAAGGDSPGNPNSNKAFEYDGSSWTATPNINQGRYFAGAVGSQTASLLFGGGSFPPSAYYTNTETYNGSTWTAVNALNTARTIYHGRVGTQTAAITASGYTGTAINTSEQWDGTNWTATGNSNTTAYGRMGFGSSTAGVLAGGFTPPGITTTELWDGSSWATSTATLGSAQHQGGSNSGTDGNAGVIFGGPGSNATTQEYNKSTNSITAAAWASSGSMNTSRYGVSGFGTQTSSIAANGDTYPPTSSRYTTAAEEYNGATWTNIPATGSGTAYTTASNLSPGSAGSVYGGEPVSARHEYWDGSSWSEQTDMNTPRYSGGGAGTQTSSLMMGGISPTPGNLLTEEWDGSSWTNQNNAPHNIYSAGASGTQTAAIVFGGNNPAVATTAEYDGTNWTTGGSLGTARAQLGGSGTQTNALAFGGSTSPPTTATGVTEGYDGTSWSTRPSLGTARRQVGSSGHVSSASLVFGGDSGSKTGATEEFTAESSAANITDFTTS